MARRFLTYFVMSMAMAQAPLEFEVASIKPASPPPRNAPFRVGSHADGARFIAEHESLLGMIEFAYELEEFRVSGGPPWVSSRDIYGTDRFEVVAQAADGTAPTLPQIRQMLQALLADRFQLKIRRETREFPSYALVVAPGGAKMTPAVRQEGVSPSLWAGGRLESRYEAKSVALSDLLMVLRSAAGRPVVDRTGLEGTYAFELRWAQGDPPPAEATAPSIFTAVQEQLGLKLESVREPFEVLVIESAERPSEN